MFVSYQVNSAWFVLEYSRLNIMILLTTYLDIIMGIFEYILGISMEANFYVGSTGVLLMLVLIVWYSLC